MNHIERRDKGMAYISDYQVFEQQKHVRILTQKLNTIDRSDFDAIREIVKELLGKSDNAFINPPFYCDYGFNIETGKLCKVIRKITEADCKFYYKDREFDEEAWAHITEMGLAGEK